MSKTKKKFLSPNEGDPCNTGSGSHQICEFGGIGCDVRHFQNLALRVLELEKEVKALRKSHKKKLKGKGPKLVPCWTCANRQGVPLGYVDDPSGRRADGRTFGSACPTSVPCPTCHGGKKVRV